MKKKVAVLQFPGINSEYETLRALKNAGMDAGFFRWNEDLAKLNTYDGFVIPGGFSYEDRGRAGLISSMEPVMLEVQKQAAKGKPVLGICNGAQILIETGLVPGGENNELLMCLARNKRVKDGKLLGRGFYNETVFMRCDAPRRTAFTIGYEDGDIEYAPVAHGEGRFTTSIEGLFPKLEENNQIVFRYSREDGVIESDFPVNPNAAMNNAAAICNPEGNVMAMMPHPERVAPRTITKIFTSMRKYMEGEQIQATPALKFEEEKPEVQAYVHQDSSIEFYVKLIITDNEAQTIENALRMRGFNVRIQKWIHYEVAHKPGINQEELAQELIDSGELLNTNKEIATVVLDSTNFSKNEGSHYFLARDKEDSNGASKLAKILHHLGAEKVDDIKHAWFWEVSGDVDINELLATNIFANHNAQVLYSV